MLELEEASQGPQLLTPLHNSSLLPAALSPTSPCVPGGRFITQDQLE